MHRNNHYLSILSGLILCTLIAGCSPGSLTAPSAVLTPTTGQLVITDGLGRSVVFNEPAQRIVSIAPSNTEILYAVGAGAQVVGRDEFSDYPEQAKALPNVGGGYGALDMESMVSLQPDLVLASQLTPAEKLESNVTDDFVRLSIGLEDYEDIEADLKQALEKV